MPWWSWRSSHAGSRETQSDVPEGNLRLGAPAQRRPADGCPSGDRPAADPAADEADPTGTVTLSRLAAGLERLGVRYLGDGCGRLLAMWERHAVLITLEGPEDEILVVRARAHSTVPPDWADRAYRVVNEWNHTRRFCKAYVGDPTERGQLPIYAELQVPLRSGATDALLVELLDCGAVVAATFVNWLHDEGALL
ncbi:MAG TPA: YbjN domain-containing protein [Micromonosporaceae bacterium]|nr:YbjN domain-containing protein [Micromonosporaceae bacterium]